MKFYCKMARNFRRFLRKIYNKKDGIPYHKKRGVHKAMHLSHTLVALYKASLSPLAPKDFQIKVKQFFR